MDFWSTLLDLVFLLLALAIIPLTRHIEPLPPPPSPSPRSKPTQVPPSPAPPSSPYLQVPDFVSGSSSPQSPVSPSVPQITITPDRSLKVPNRGSGQTHKRKSVSFSLSSMDDLKSGGEAVPMSLRRRPPTPFVNKVEESELSPCPSMPGTPVGLSSLDPMGVQKKWLMG